MYGDVILTSRRPAVRALSAVALLLVAPFLLLAVTLAVLVLNQGGP